MSKRGWEPSNAAEILGAAREIIVDPKVEAFGPGVTDIPKMVRRSTGAQRLIVLHTTRDMREALKLEEYLVKALRKHRKFRKHPRLKSTVTKGEQSVVLALWGSQLAAGVFRVWVRPPT